MHSDRKRTNLSWAAKGVNRLKPAQPGAKNLTRHCTVASRSILVRNNLTSYLGQIERSQFSNSSLTARLPFQSKFTLLSQIFFVSSAFTVLYSKDREFVFGPLVLISAACQHFQKKLFFFAFFSPKRNLKVNKMKIEMPWIRSKWPKIIFWALCLFFFIPLTKLEKTWAYPSAARWI